MNKLVLFKKTFKKNLFYLPYTNYKSFYFAKPTHGAGDVSNIVKLKTSHILSLRE